MTGLEPFKSYSFDFEVHRTEHPTALAVGIQPTNSRIRKMPGYKVDLSFLWRKKQYDSVTLEQTKLSRVLGLLDITAIGTAAGA